VSADYGARPAVISVDEWDRVYRRVMLHDVVVGKLQTLPETVRTMADDLAEIKATVADLREWKEDTKVQRIAGLEKLVDRYEVTERKREAQARRDRRRVWGLALAALVHTAVSLSVGWAFAKLTGAGPSPDTHERK